MSDTTDVPVIDIPMRKDNPVIRECHAYSQSGEKCSHPAGHPGDHAIIITWTDDECWSPQRVPSIPMGVADGLVTITPGIAYTPEPVGSGMCGICEHPHHPDGRCGADDGGFDCDCMTSVED